MLLLPFLMIKKSFWISEQRLLTSNWTKIIYFNESDRRIYCSLRPGPNSVIRVKEVRKNRERRSGCLVRISWRVGNHLYHPLHWSMNNPWKINWMISVRDYLTSRTLKMVISNVSPVSWPNDSTEYIHLALFSVHRQDRTATSGKTRGGVCVYLSITAGARCLILRRFQDIAHLR